ncbi:MAG TPA: anthranilate synthase component I family protein [Caulobacteraceae bacterium]|nr:anthranilate synthase component I family protein [Caulobacteraceae bacterium]
MAIASRRAAWREPVEVLSAFADEPWAIGFLSGGDGPDARWSYLARAPEATLVLKGGDGGAPFAALARMVGPPCPWLIDGPPFQGGVAGLAAYELGDHVERLGLGRHSDWPDLACGLYPAVLAFDHARREVVAVGRGRDAAEARVASDRALDWLEMPPVAASAGALAGPLSASSGAAYERATAEVVARIGRGEVFQANIARVWTGRLKPDRRPFDLLARLAAASPAPFAGYLRLDDRALVSNAPERFLRVAGGADGWVVETQPIKGTRPRGRDGAEDAALAAELAASAKDRAENLMIVDLMRNDLARVCVPGTVATPALCRVASFANVHHLVSTVTGRLAAGRSAVDLLRAAFPPGSITGAPKVQAMKLIAGLEPPRGPFFGSLFWAGFDGAFDSSVLIRSVGFRLGDNGWRLEARAGAGIVADSDPWQERLETEAKIGAIAGALLDEPISLRHGPTCSDHP